MSVGVVTSEVLALVAVPVVVADAIVALLVAIETVNWSVGLTRLTIDFVIASFESSTANAKPCLPVDVELVVTVCVLVAAVVRM